MMTHLIKVDYAERIMQEARDSISRYCIDVCMGQCCFSGFLPSFDEDDVRVCLGIEDNKISLKEYSCLYPEKLERYNGIYLVHFPCAKFKNKKCEIHEDPIRPVMCGLYPIRSWWDSEKRKKVIEYTRDCTAITEGILDPYLKTLDRMGFEFKVFP